MISIGNITISDASVGNVSIGQMYVGSTLVWKKGPSYDEMYPIINVINGVNYYRYTPKEQFVVYTGVGGGGDQVSYYRFEETTRYNYNRLWGSSKTITGPNSDPPRYFGLSSYTVNGYIYNKTRKEWLYRGVNVSEDMFDE